MIAPDPNLLAQGGATGTSIGAIVVTILVSSGFTSIVVVIITGFINRRNLKADTATKISDAAGTILEKVNKDNDRLRAEEKSTQGRVRKLERAVRVLTDSYLETLKELEASGVDVTPRRLAVEAALQDLEEEN